MKRMGSAIILALFALSSGYIKGQAPINPKQAAPANQVVDRITKAELDALLRRFVAHYQAGDLDRFMALFAQAARTNESINRAEIRLEYARLFWTTDMRRMTLRNVSWDRKHNPAQGWADFEVKVRTKGERKIRTYTGNLAFQIEKQGQRIRITRFYHQAGRGKIIITE